jgi:hypothetical protein
MYNVSLPLRLRPLFAAAAFAALAAGGPAPARGAPAVPQLQVTATVSGCTFSVDVAWSGFNGGNDTLEVFLVQVFPATNDGLILQPSVFVRPIKGKGGSVSVTLPAIAGSATTNSFRAAAQLLDQRGTLISPSQHLSDTLVAFCTGV